VAQLVRHVLRRSGCSGIRKESRARAPQREGGRLSAFRALWNLVAGLLFAPDAHGVRADTEDVPILLYHPK
jgi:hypothetical protein